MKTIEVPKDHKVVVCGSCGVPIAYTPRDGCANLVDYSDNTFEYAVSLECPACNKVVKASWKCKERIDVMK